MQYNKILQNNIARPDDDYGTPCSYMDCTCQIKLYDKWREVRCLCRLCCVYNCHLCQQGNGLPDIALKDTLTVKAQCRAGRPVIEKFRSFNKYPCSV